MNMAGSRVLGGVTVLLQNQNGLSSASQPLDSLFLAGSSKNSSSSSSSSFLGSRSMMSFQNVHGVNGSNTSLFQSFDHDETGDDEFDEYFHQPGKKRRLSVDQVQFLEKNFELENKLEPERKIQLAKDLGLQPRQVAIWFQNRRARWKTKQLEKDYEALLANYNSLKADYESLFKENDKLKAEILALKDKLLLREKEGVNLELSETNKLMEQTQKMPSEEELALKDEVSKVSAMVCKQEDISSAKSDILDADSPSRYTDGAHSSVLMEPADSSYVFEHDQSDLSQDEEDNLNKSLFPSYIFPKLEYDDYSDPPASSCNFGFPAVEDNAFWSWSY